MKKIMRKPISDSRSANSKAITTPTMPKTEDGAQPQTLRLNKAIASRGFCSRRKADELIFSGKVMVDGVTVTDPSLRVGPDAEITTDGHRLPGGGICRYLMMNKAVRTVCTANDPEGRPTVLDALPPEYRSERLFPVGRLDYFSEGLLILTNDGELAHRLMHPRFHLPKRYEVLVRGPVPHETLLTMRRGMILAEGEKLAPVEVQAHPAQNGTTRLSMTLHQGVNRQIRRMCRDLNLTVLRLQRVAQGPLNLGGLASGSVRALSPDETMALKKAVALPC